MYRAYKERKEKKKKRPSHLQLLQNLYDKTNTSLVKLSLICGSRSIRRDKPNEHVADKTLYSASLSVYL